MITDAAVSCPLCGASTPLPTDLRMATFSCNFCHASLKTAAFTGTALRSADALLGHVRAIAEQGTPLAGQAPRFESEQAVEQQLKGNAVLARLKAEGLHCRKCSGHNAVPDDGSAQIICQFCGVAILLSDYVDGDAVARDRLKHGIFQLKDQVIQKQEAQDRRLRWIILGTLAFLAGIGGLISFLGVLWSRLH